MNGALQRTSGIAPSTVAEEDDDPSVFQRRSRNNKLIDKIVPVCYGGIFSTSVGQIKKQNVKVDNINNVWNKAENLLSRGNNIVEGHFMERTWSILLSNPLPKYQLHALREYSNNFQTIWHGKLYHKKDKTGKEEEEIQRIKKKRAKKKQKQEEEKRKEKEEEDNKQEEGDGSDVSNIDVDDDDDDDSDDGDDEGEEQEEEVVAVE